jgi:predicted transcriptional regulator
MTRVISTRVSDDIANELKNICKDTARTRTFHVNKAIEFIFKIMLIFK